MNHHDMTLKTYDMLGDFVTDAIKNGTPPTAIIYAMAMMLAYTVHATTLPGKARYVLESLTPYQLEHLAKLQLNAATPAGSA